MSAPLATELETTDVAPRNRVLLKAILTDPAAVFGVVVILVILAAAVGAALFAPFDPSQQDIMLRREGPSGAHLLGTDNLGRDLLSRLMYGGRATLLGGTLAVVVSLTVGVPLGLIAGYRGGFVESGIMRVIDVLLSFPSFLSAIVIVAVLGPSLHNAAIAIGIAGVPQFARLVRGQVLSMKQREFVLGAVASGASSLRIMFKYILPNLLYSILAYATLSLATAVLAIAGLSFLGLGAQPPTPEWGLMVRDGREFLRDAPHIALWPGLAIMLLILAFNLIGDAAQRGLSPRDND